MESSNDYFNINLIKMNFFNTHENIIIKYYNNFNDINLAFIKIHTFDQIISIST